MEHLENDMDDLFQKAGELYPLKTTGSDWDAVAGKLQNDIPGGVDDLSGPTAVRTRNKRKWLLLLLLIPLGFGISYYSGRINPGQQNGISSGAKSGSEDQNKIKTAVPDNQTATVVPKDKNMNAASGNTQPMSGIKNTAENSHAGGSQSDKNKKLVLLASGKHFTSNSSLHLQKQIPPATGNTKTDFSATGTNPALKETDGAAAAKPVDNPPSAVTESTGKKEAVAVPVIISAQNQADAAPNKTDKTELSKKVSQDSASVTKKTNTNSKQSKGFYLSLFGGPDLSAVKFQGVHQVGSSFGIILGYRFNKLALETGLIWDQKYYYSSGEYFKNSPQVYYPPNTTFNGHCDMFEIPLLVRYDFSPDKNQGFFAKAGLSSYLMTHQYYSKKIDGVDNGSWPWTENANYIFSIVQLSGGYEFSIGRKTKIQIEPYIKIPLRGLGEGNMPISSAGIYFGITHSFR